MKTYKNVLFFTSKFENGTSRMWAGVIITEVLSMPGCLTLGKAGSVGRRNIKYFTRRK
jgi:hypothetical protein